MRQVLDCDQVFEILTRASFPTGGPDDAAVERHLAACHECRQLAEALRPAVELFHESLAEDQQKDLPGYYGRVGIFEDSRRATQLQSVTDDRPLVRAPRVRRSLSSRLDRFPVSMTALAVAALFILLWFAGVSDQISRPDRGPGEVWTPVDPAQRSPLQQLVALRLPEACRPGTVQPQKQDAGASGLAVDQGKIATTVDLAASHGFVCCTQCHATSGSARVPESAMATVLRSCRSCHGS